MNNIFRNTRKLSLVLGALLLAVTLAAGSFAYLTRDARDALKASSESASSTDESAAVEESAPEAAPAMAQTKPEDDTPPQYNIPGEMRGVYLTPGLDFLKNKGDATEAIKAEIDKAIANAKELTMNAVIIDTVYGDNVIFKTTDAPQLASDFDILQYIVDAARKNDMFTYAIFDTSFFAGKSVFSPLAIGKGSGDKLSSNAAEFAEKYKVDGILIDGYTTEEKTDADYSTYINTGGAIGFDNFLRQTPAAIVKTAAKAIRSGNKNTQAGLLADAVWANQAENGEGSATTAAYTALNSGNADTKGYVERGLVDFVAVKAFSSLDDSAEPFGEVVNWWAQVTRENGVPMYVVHASSKACTQETGWASHDQLTKQVIEASDISGFNGSIFNSLAKLVENPKETTTTLVKYYNQEVSAEHVLTELAVTKPEKTTYSTFEQSVTFTGASDPNSKVTINGEEIKTDKSGYFTVMKELEAGENKFTISHKEKEINYVITRQVQILRDVSPTGSITTEGGMSVTISVFAYADADVYATVGGVTVPMHIDDSVTDESDRDSSFKLFVGEYAAPAATGSVQNVGSITVHGSWQGHSETLAGASIAVNKKAQLEDGVAVVVVADQAFTYSADTLNNIPTTDCYPLPKGAMDYAVGDEIVYKKDNETFTYTMLASGVRVESKDITPTSDYPSNNGISDMTVSAADDGYTYVTIKTAQKVSYRFSYTGDSVQILFNNTVQSPEGAALNSNPIFTKASWSGGNTLTLTLAKSGGFMGYKGYYDTNGNLVFKFNNPPKSLAGARIAIDPGHGGADPGTLGFLPDYPEKVINLAIAQQLADELTSRGATVKLLEVAGYEGPQRVVMAENWNADILVSVHNNSAPSSSAVGTEVYYFYPFSKNLAYGAAANVSSQLGTVNRGHKASYYRVTLSSQMASVLVECGFLTNKAEYERLITSKYQQRVAVGIADSLASAIKSANTGLSATGTQSSGSGATAGEESSSSGETTGNADVEGVALNYDVLEVGVGKAATLKATVEPDDAKSKKVIWKSSRTSVATVDENGVVTGVKEGSATITVMTAEGDYTATCDVTVTANGGGAASSGSGEDYGMALSKANDAYMPIEDMTVYPGNSQRIDVYNEEAAPIRNADFSWSSSKTSVATVDKYGVVTAKAEGEATITAKASGYTLTCYVTVSRTKVTLKSISLNKTSLDVVMNKTAQLTVSFSPSDSTNKNVTWTSSNTKIASVDSNGLVKGVNTGSATITAKSDDGKFTAACKVTVTRSGVAADYIDLSDYDYYLEKGRSYKLTATVYPDNASDKTVVWKSSNSNIVTVDSNGKITGVRAGTAKITCTSASDSSIYETCTVEVY